MQTLVKKYIVQPNQTAKNYASGTVDVLATPALVGFMEDVAKSLIDPMLAQGESSVGTKISTTHVKASPIGAQIVVEATLLKHEGRFFDFAIKATQDGELVGEGEHTRASINVERFMAKLK